MEFPKLLLIRTGFILSPVMAMVFLALNLSGVVLAIAGFAATALFFMDRWHARNSSNVCPECNHEFCVTPWVDVVSPHTPEKNAHPAAVSAGDTYTNVCPPHFVIDFTMEIEQT